MTGWDRNPRLKQRIPVPAPPEHEHSAADISTGTLPIVRGGTGATTAADARAALAATYAGHIGNLSDLDDYGQYPDGYSVGYFSYTAAGRPCDYGTVVTNKAVGTRTFQMAHAHQSDEVYTRYYYDGWSAWRRLAQEGQHGIPFAMAAGVVSVSVSASAGGTASVTFPVGRFTQQPRVMVTKQGAQLAKFVPYATSITSSGATIGIYAGDGLAATASVSVGWEAIQMTESSGSG